MNQWYQDSESTCSPGISARFAALQSGAVDAAIDRALHFYAASAGFNIIGRTADYVTDLPQNGTVIAAGCRPRVHLGKFLSAFNKGVAWFGDDRNREEAINILVVTGNLKPEEVAKS
jgi:hypothetical protein